MECFNTGTFLVYPFFFSEEAATREGNISPTDFNMVGSLNMVGGQKHILFLVHNSRLCSQ